MCVAHEIDALVGPNMCPWMETHENNRLDMIQALKNHYDNLGEIREQ